MTRLIHRSSDYLVLRVLVGIAAARTLHKRSKCSFCIPFPRDAGRQMCPYMRSLWEVPLYNQVNGVIHPAHLYSTKDDTVEVSVFNQNELNVKTQKKREHLERTSSRPPVLQDACPPGHLSSTQTDAEQTKSFLYFATSLLQLEMF